MKVLRYFMFIIIVLLSFNLKVNASSCDSTDIKRLKLLAENVEFSYEYNDPGEDVGFSLVTDYTVTINNLTDELYIYDAWEDKSYIDAVTNDSMLVINNVYSGKRTFKIYSRNCDRVLKTVYLKLAAYNYYSEDPLCEGKEDLNICQKFYDTANITYYEFENIIKEYENKINNVEVETVIQEKTFLDYIKDNIYISGGIVLALIIFVIIIIVIRNKKRSILE